MSLSQASRKSILNQYHGFNATPALWSNNSILNLKQFHYNAQFNLNDFQLNTLPNRLGKRVEHFVCQEINQHPDMNLLAHNLQIQQHKHTIGELDALLHVSNKPIHLEIIYKFYLYDPNVGTTALDHWIGPNRNDSLMQKLTKLKTKQLPLLQRSESLPYLNNYQLNAQEIEQYVLFKAQLYMPKTIDIVDVSPLNSDCLMGTYINHETLPSLSNCQFYLPPKLDWLVQTNQDVNWLSYNNILEPLHSFLTNKQSPLVWIKHPDNTLERCFIVWW